MKQKAAAKAARTAARWNGVRCQQFGRADQVLKNKKPEVPELERLQGPNVRTNARAGEVGLIGHSQNFMTKTRRK